MIFGPMEISSTPPKQIRRVIPSELVAKLANICVSINREEFQIGHISEVLEVLARQSLAEAGMVRPAGINPCRRRGSKIGPRGSGTSRG